jgi:hypothetical protein
MKIASIRIQWPKIVIICVPCTNKLRNSLNSELISRKRSFKKQKTLQKFMQTQRSFYVRELLFFLLKNTNLGLFVFF